jgi:hypothetical protein
MGTVLQIAASKLSARRRGDRAAGECQIVIFPGVRIERHADEASVDLGHRLLDSTGTGNFDGFSGKGGRPRRTS